ncbi:MAG: N-6 DNA methylase [Coleofasciculaceae cyanobacterium RL_1_1]|nr:N-6 DNA methylase [Coleofasciculaceae cyanobacterium RL_1_1]
MSSKFLPESINASTTTRIDRLLTESDEREQEITDRLYAQYKDVRQALVTFFRAKAPRHLKDRNTAIVSAAQKILDRVLFIAFCEDKGLLPRQTLKHATEYKDPYHPQDTWLNYTAIFRWVDVGHRRSPVQNQPIPGYNGGLFASDPLVDEMLTVPDWLCEKLSGLADYDYESEVSVNILGHIFEQSVTDLEELRAFAEGTIDEFDPKQGKRKRQGVFYTPEWVTRYMVETALGGYLDRQFVMLRERFGLEETLAGASRELEIELWRSYRDEVLSTVRVLDPACGSGAFLIAAFEFLELQYRQVRSTLVELATGETDDANNPEFDRTLILRNNLFGVDLSAESVEITKLSLWLQTAEPGKKLTDLDHNIRVGNSIIAVKKYDKKAFKWEQEFSKIVSTGGFDVVLGNPPYVRQEFLSVFKPYLQKQYECYDGVADLYTYFYERGFNLLKPGGVLSYIVTNKWLRAGYGEGLRRFFCGAIGAGANY